MFKTVGWPEIIVFLVVVLLVFGVGRVSKLGAELGKGIRAFKDGLSGKSEEETGSEDNIDDTQD